MRRKVGILLLALAGVAMSGCELIDNLRQDKRDHEAIQAALDKYLAAHVDLSAVTVENEEFNTDRDRAEIIVQITVKQSKAESKRKYTLAREGGVWMVKTDQLFSGGVAEGQTSTPAPANQKP
ncbi:MAG: hypothetical protein GZ088_07505 [Acidipila sp.]|nr:hypothetical protein [Acidipila sp.]